jgi:hypothetical protein
VVRIDHWSWQVWRASDAFKCAGFGQLYAHPSVSRWEELRITPVMCGGWTGLFSRHATTEWAIWSDAIVSLLSAQDENERLRVALREIMAIEGPDDEIADARDLAWFALREP